MNSLNSLHPLGVVCWLYEPESTMVYPELGFPHRVGRYRPVGSPSWFPVCWNCRNMEEFRIRGWDLNLPVSGATSTARGRERTSLGSILPCAVWKPQPHWLSADWLGLMEPARGKSCPSGQRRGPAAPGEERVSSPDQNSFHISTTPINRGRNRRSPGSIPSRRVWKPQPHWVIADWLGLMEPARGKSCPSGRGRGLVAHGEDKVPSPDQKFSISLQLQEPGDQDGDPTSRYRPTRYGNPSSGCTIVDWGS